MLFTIPSDRSQTEFARCKLECSYWYHLKCFLASSVFPSFQVRKIENESFPCTYALGEWTGWVLGDNSYRVRTNTWKELRRCCSPIGHNKSIFIKAFFEPNQEPALSWPFGNGLVSQLVPRGLFRLYLKTFAALFLSTQLMTAPGSQWMDLPCSLPKLRWQMKN